MKRPIRKRFIELVPWLAQRYALAPQEVGLFGDFKKMIAARKRLTGIQRRWFDRMHSALARLAVLHDRPGGSDRATEEALVEQLQKARLGTEG